MTDDDVECCPDCGITDIGGMGSQLIRCRNGHSFVYPDTRPRFPTDGPETERSAWERGVPIPTDYSTSRLHTEDWEIVEACWRLFESDDPEYRDVINSGVTKEALADDLGVSTDTILNRCRRLASDGDLVTINGLSEKMGQIHTYAPAALVDDEPDYEDPTPAHADD